MRSSVGCQAGNSQGKRTYGRETHAVIPGPVGVSRLRVHRARGNSVVIHKDGKSVAAGCRHAPHISLIEIIRAAVGENNARSVITSLGKLATLLAKGLHLVGGHARHDSPILAKKWTAPEVHPNIISSRG